MRWVYYDLVAASIQYQTSIFNGTTSYSNVAIGTEASSRIVSVITQSSLRPSAMTAGGVAGTLALQNGVNLTIYTFPLPTGTTATITANQTAHLLGVFSMYNLASTTPIDTAQLTNSGGHLVNIDVFARGVAIGGFTSNNGSVTTWTGLTKDIDQNPVGVVSAAHSSFSISTTNFTVDCTPDLGGVFNMVVASWSGVM